MYDVVALGELLIDFVSSEPSKQKLSFEGNPGGAPANVLCALAKLGKKTAFIGKVGHDQFGFFLREVLERNQIDTKGLVYSHDVNTTLAFVQLDDRGDRSFAFYRKPGADMMLNTNDVNLELIRNAGIFHFGSISMTHEPAKTATLQAAEYAQKNGLLISYDPNFRVKLWDDLNEAKDTLMKGMQYANILKISEEELDFLLSIKNYEEGSRLIWERYHTELILITLGEKGCYYRFGENTGLLPGYQVETIDTTGAGDAFLGAVLYGILENRKCLNELSVQEIEVIIDLGNAVGAFSTTRKGAIPALPSHDEILVFRKGNNEVNPASEQPKQW